MAYVNEDGSSGSTTKHLTADYYTTVATTRD